MNQKQLSKLVIALSTIAAAVYFVETGAVSGTVGFSAVLMVAGAYGVYEIGRRQPQPGEDTDRRA